MSASSDSAANMQLALGVKIGRMRSFRRFESAQIALPSVYNDQGIPLADSPGPRYSKESTSVVNVCSSQVLTIDGLGHITEICESVIAPDSIDMVNVVGGPTADDIQPCQTVCRLKFPINGDSQVTILAKTSGRLSLLRATARLSPHEYPSFGIVMKKFAQTLRGKIGNSHDALQLLIGQKPRSVSALPGLRHFKGAAA